ncbi:YybH family protein [Gemmatimonadota bacterium]
MRALAAFAILLLVSACQASPPAEMTEAEKAQIEAEVASLDQAMGSAVAAWDLDAFLGSFSENLSWTLYGEAHHSLESWTEQVTPFFSSNEPLDRCEFINPRVQVLTREVAISTSVVNCFAPSPEGPVLVIDHTWTAVWAKEDSQWKIVNVSETYRPSEVEG